MFLPVMTQGLEIRCPHCGEAMRRWTNPEGSSWSGAFQYVCFNDACPYYVRGWEWMKGHFNVTGSYRHRLDPETGESGPLPVWSPEDFRNQIVPEPGEERNHAV